MSEPDRFPSRPARNAFYAARDARRSARVERERRVVEGLKGGVAMAEIARREGITVRGLRKYVRNLIASRAPEATGEFIATQLNRLNEALLVSFDAMSGENLPAVDRVVRIVRELDRYHGLSGGARGTETRRKLLESLDSGAGLEAPLMLEDESSDPLADLDLAACLGDRLSPGPGAGGTEMRSKLLESLDSGAGTAPGPDASPTTVLRTVPLPRADAQGRKGAGASPPPCSVSEMGEGNHPKGGGGGGPRDGSGITPGTPGTERRRNPLESPDSGADAAPVPWFGDGALSRQVR